MYIWCALDVSLALSEVRRGAISANRDIGLSEVAFSLPQHVSLLISFPADDRIAEKIISDIRTYLSGSVMPRLTFSAPELYGNIIWIPIEASDELTRLHEDLLAITHSYGIEPHTFDRKFAFHSTLFVDSSEEKLSKILTRVARLPIPERITAEGFIIGVSESGAAGDYRVIYRSGNNDGKDNKRREL
jgi:2'-5' RNA ligase